LQSSFGLFVYFIFVKLKEFHREKSLGKCSRRLLTKRIWTIITTIDITVTSSSRRWIIYISLLSTRSSIWFHFSSWRCWCCCGSCWM